MIKIPKTIKTLIQKHFNRLAPMDLERIYKLGYMDGRKDAYKDASKIFKKVIQERR